MRISALTFASFFMLVSAAQAQDIRGTWQADGKPQRVLKIGKTAQTYHGDLYNLGDEAPGAPRNGNGISAITLMDGSIRFSLDEAQGDFDGKLSDDGNSIAGTWKTLYGPPQPLTFMRAQTAWVVDPSPHKSLFVTVQPGVKLEVLDWGGKGPPLILLNGLGGTAHGFDAFAPKLTDKHHVYGITRRGFGASGSPPATDENYDADRLGDDVLAVMAALRIEKPVIAGHSIAGGELSSVGTRHPERIAGLIYLDSLFQYAFYNPAQEDLAVDSAIVRRDLDRMFDLQTSPAQWRALIAEIQAQLPKLQKSLQQTADMLEGAPEMLGAVQKPEDLAGNKIVANARAYGPASVPVLAILALPRRCQPNCDKPFMQKIMAADAARADAFEKANPQARVVRLAGASHFIWRSNEADVLREMNGFMDGLKH
jgi:pimeloyl-ACP methyl ester carboxylesterase